MAQPRSTGFRRMGGFRPAARLVAERVRSVGESRGFAVARLLTHWAEIVGPDISARARPLRISFRRDGLGAVLTLLTNGANAPMVQMEIPRIREKVNACYGYNAVSRISLAQTTPEPGFAETQSPFAAAPVTPQPATEPPDPELPARAKAMAGDIRDDGLRAALEALARNVLSRDKKSKDELHG